jgi:hypothetical protein
VNTKRLGVGTEDRRGIPQYQGIDGKLVFEYLSGESVGEWNHRETKHVAKQSLQTLYIKRLAMSGQASFG